MGKPNFLDKIFTNNKKTDSNEYNNEQLHHLDNHFMSTIAHFPDIIFIFSRDEEKVTQNRNADTNDIKLGI
ncbi:hypothetical protein [Virgibacillus halodenitrificans]|uniref:hypothetical protein n=1 Tax=Virgibacillus halodenitrificans TaxID=1482 RepID=UPI002DB6B801|nr:hypothetical protein [Virgibacillus halodenitrificans]MEC2159733.1 hypothetical protein [Virgibacillus halodenitrificans]